jgi:hypothetical protein
MKLYKTYNLQMYPYYFVQLVYTIPCLHILHPNLVSSCLTTWISQFAVQQEVDLQYRFLLNGSLHPHGLTRRSVAGGGVSPACGAVPATAMVTAAAVAGLVLSSLGSARVEDAEGLQVDVISTTQH